MMRVSAVLALAACSFPEKRFVGNQDDGGMDGSSKDGQPSDGIDDGMMSVGCSAALHAPWAPAPRSKPFVASSTTSRPTRARRHSFKRRA